MASQSVQNLPDDAIFWKVTGRYKVINLQQMLKTIPRDTELYCDLRGGKSPWFDMRVMAWTKAGFERSLSGFYSEIREDLNRGRPGEETAFNRIIPRIGSTRARLTLAREPLIDGVRAFDNKNWSRGRQRIVYYIRQAQRLAFGKIIA